MRRDSVIRNLLAAGLNSQTAEKAADAKLTLTDLRNASKKSLEATFVPWEVTEIKKLQRQPIDDAVIEQLVEKCDWACCMCWDLDDRQPIILHHLEEHAFGGDDSYDNLVILCLNHHGKAHSKWEISRHPMPPESIKRRKKDFEDAIALFKDGKRCAPGREKQAAISDLECLDLLGKFIDRPAMFRPFAVEGNMRDFLDTLSRIIDALSTGHISSRDGRELNQSKSYRDFQNPDWKDRLKVLRDQFDAIRERVEIAIRTDELHVTGNGEFYCFNNPKLPEGIDAMRHSAACMLNDVLRVAGLPEVHPPRIYN